MSNPSLLPKDALLHVVRELRKREKRFALVGGLAVSVRGEVRTTRDVDLAVAVENDEELEALVADLGGSGYRVLATVEHEELDRLATVRLASPVGFMVDLLAASCGIEPEIVGAATTVQFESVGAIPVATSEDLLAMKVLAAHDGRPQDWNDARALMETNPGLDLPVVRSRLRLITERGFARKQDLAAKLQALIDEVAATD
ncbi:MAG: nucleotidyl transferase AbiEii/AbiGii toxin family protein [Myxococcales bacterium]